MCCGARAARSPCGPIVVGLACQCAGIGPHLSGRVAAVEYQGAMVRVALAMEDGDEASALVPDGEFYARPVEPGEPATLVWAELDAHALAEA